MDEAKLSEIQGWVQLAVVVIGGLMVLVKQWKTAGEQAEVTRWARVLSMVKPAHRLAQKVAQSTHTAKDDEFLRQISRLLAVVGIKLDDAEADAVRALGSAEHQDFKLLRDGPVAMEPPLLTPEEESRLKGILAATPPPATGAALGN